MTAQSPPPLHDLEARRVFATVVRSMLGMEAALPKIARFEVRERLGSGGMGEVYGAHDPEHDREVAIKILRQDRGADPVAITRMRREARALARLEHPNVVRVHEVGVVDTQVFIVMERLRGQTLAQGLEREGPLSPARTYTVLAAVCRALQRAHERGIVHRDLKPGNIFLRAGADPSVKVLDFGLAKIMSGQTFDLSTASGTVMGTLHYMSPEQARDSTRAEPRWDLWAVAIIAYECLVGARPFQAGTLAELAVELLAGESPVPSEHGRVPVGFDAWFARATHAEPSRRFGSALELGDALAQALGQPRPARPTARARRLVGPGLVVAAGLMGAVGVGVGVGVGGEASVPAESSSPAEASGTRRRVPAVLPAADAGVEPVTAPPPRSAPPRAPSIELRIEGAPTGATVWMRGEPPAVPRARDSRGPSPADRRKTSPADRRGDPPADPAPKPRRTSVDDLEF